MYPYSEKVGVMKKNTVLKTTVKALLSYIGCIMMAFFVMYFLNGTVGVLLMTALIIALILSVISALAVMPSLKVDMHLDRQVLFKGEDLICTVSMTKKYLSLPQWSRST